MNTSLWFLAVAAGKGPLLWALETYQILKQMCPLKGDVEDVLFPRHLRPEGDTPLEQGDILIITFYYWKYEQVFYFFRARR